MKATSIIKLTDRNYNWKLAKLGALATIRYGKNLPTKSFVESGYPVFGANGVIGFHRSYLYEEEQVLISCRGAYSGKINLSPPQCFVTNNSLVLELPADAAVSKRFLFYGLQAVDRSKMVTGSAQPQVTINNAEVVELPVPSHDEQRRIVAEIEKQFTRLEAGVAALKRVQANLKRYRTAVLKFACEGRLVASDLSSWKRLKVFQVGEAVTGNTPPTSDKENLGDEVPFLKPTDLDVGYNVREARQYLSAKGAKFARVLPANAVLVTCIGATIGKTGFARVACATNQQINALVVNPKIAIAEWVFWSFASPDGQQQIKNNASATTLPILNKSKFEALEISLPPLAEQRRIVAEVERRLSVVEELETVVSANLQRATRLRQAILQQAFSGKLCAETGVPYEKV